MYNIFYENPEQMEIVKSELSKFRARIVAKNINSFELNDIQIESILKDSSVYKDARGH